MTYKLQKAKDECLRIQARIEKALKLIRSITYKHKPSSDDIKKLKVVERLLND